MAKTTAPPRTPRRPTRDSTGEFPFAVTDYVPHLIAAISQFRDSRLDGALRKLSLNVGRYRVLGVLRRFDVCTMTELARFTAIDRTTLTRIADRLVDDGLAERRSDPRDRRQVRLALTADGVQRHRAALRIVLELNTRLLAGVPEAQGRAAARTLQAIVGNLAPTPAARNSIIHYSREALEEAGK
jgi:DNA-binding MarR family transcriptional regulator